MIFFFLLFGFFFLLLVSPRRLSLRDLPINLHPLAVSLSKRSTTRIAGKLLEEYGRKAFWGVMHCWGCVPS